MVQVPDDQIADARSHARQVRLREQLEAAICRTLADLGKRFAIHVYSDADHGFFRHGGTDRTAADVSDSWDRVRAMLAVERSANVER